MRKTIIINLLLISFLGLGILLEGSDYFKATKKRLQRITVPTPPLKFGKRGALLEKLGLTYVFPKDYTRFFDPISGHFNFDAAISLDSPRPEQHRNWVKLDRIPPQSYPSSTILDQALIDTGHPILSVVVSDKDLYDPATGIIANRKRKGRAWERPCFISYYEKGKLRFASGAGIRIHGGSKYKRETESLRFYFRKIYGYDQFKPGIIFDDDSVPIKQVIARIENKYANLLALDISSRIGSPVAKAHPVAVYLNGEKYGKSYALIEHLDKNWLRSHFGHDNFVLLRTTGHPERRKKSLPYQRLKSWVDDEQIDMTMAEAEKYVDVENLSRWYLSQLFTAGNDMYQGPLLLDKTRSDAKWFWVNWDMDQSFHNPFEREKKNLWEQELNFHNVMVNPERDRKNPKTARYQRKDPRPILFRRLRNEDPAFQKYFEGLFMDTMNHRINPRFMAAWIDEREAELLRLTPENRVFFRKLKEFIRHRPAYLRKLMQQYFGSARSFPCRVIGLNTMTDRIDGYPATTPYKGWYFEGSDITVTIGPLDNRRIVQWFVNGEPVESKQSQFRYTVKSQTTIKPVFK